MKAKFWSIVGFVDYFLYKFQNLQFKKYVYKFQFPK